MGCGHRVAADGGSGWANSILLMGTLQNNYDQMFINELLEKHWERKRANARTSCCLSVSNILLKKRIVLKTKSLFLEKCEKPSKFHVVRFRTCIFRNTV